MSSNGRGLPDEEEEESKVPIDTSSDSAKHKRGRRGKKRKNHRSGSDFGENNINEITDADENQLLHTNAIQSHRRRAKDILIRPINVPKAPKNSTQFIIDDHEGCGLFFSFESPNPYRSSNRESGSEAHQAIGKLSEDAAFQDIDYKYESPQDQDDSAYYNYYKQEFEMAYNTSRSEELLQKSQQELAEDVGRLENDMKLLEETLLNVDPTVILNHMQQELLELQDENKVLVERNKHLKSIFNSDSNDSGSEHEELVDEIEVKESYDIEGIDPGSESADEVSDNEVACNNEDLLTGNSRISVDLDQQVTNSRVEFITMESSQLSEYEVTYSKSTRATGNISVDSDSNLELNVELVTTRSKQSNFDSDGEVTCSYLEQSSVKVVTSEQLNSDAVSETACSSVSERMSNVEITEPECESDAL